MKRLIEYNDRVGEVEVSPVEAYTPRLEDAAEAIGKLLVFMRERGELTHDQAMGICGKWGVYEDGIQ